MLYYHDGTAWHAVARCVASAERELRRERQQTLWEEAA